MGDRRGRRRERALYMHSEPRFHSVDRMKEILRQRSASLGKLRARTPPPPMGLDAGRVGHAYPPLSLSDRILYMSLLANPENNKNFIVKNQNLFNDMVAYVEHKAQEHGGNPLAAIKEQGKNLSKLTLGNAYAKRIDNLQDKFVKKLAKALKSSEKGRGKKARTDEKTTGKIRPQFKQRPHEPTEEERAFIEDE